MITRLRRSARYRRSAAGAATALLGCIAVAGATSPGALAAYAGAPSIQADCPWVNSPAPVDEKVGQVLGKMTPEQKTTLLHGNGAATPYIGNTDPIPELCVPSLGLQDGPAGVGDGLDGVTQLPAPVASAATWDTALAGEYGRVMGREFAGKGANVALGPTINISRDPRWGRNFETFSEDPYLNSRFAVSTVQGIQSQGVMADAKHAAAYNVEGAHRGEGEDNVIIDNRALQEIYLPAFQAATGEGGAASVMCGYNAINGVPDCQNPAALTDGIKKPANWDGFVLSDWGAATGDAPKLANGGLDQEMPGDGFFGQGLLDAVARGEVAQQRVDDMARRVLTQMFKIGLFDHGPTGNPDAVVTTPQHTEIARKVAADGSVLLKNADGVLPLQGVKSIALSGGAGIDPQYTGGGSGKVNPSPDAVNPIDGIKNRAGAGVNVQYTAAAGEHVDEPDIPAAVEQAKNSDVAVVFASYSEGETQDLPNIDLQHQQNELIDAVSKANPRTVVVLNTGSAVTMPWLDEVAGVVEAWYPGQEAGNSIAALLFGDTNPSGKLPVTFPRSLADVPANTPEQWPGTDHISYREGMNVGYRWYDSQRIPPLFPFGFGLSYTSFQLSGQQVEQTDPKGGATVSATVTNTGKRAGAEVSQLYIGHPGANGEPPKQLKGHHKVQLEPGQSKTVQFEVTARDLAHWVDDRTGWSTTPGEYPVFVGNDSATPQQAGAINVS